MYVQSLFLKSTLRKKGGGEIGRGQNNKQKQ